MTASKETDSKSKDLLLAALFNSRSKLYKQENPAGLLLHRF